MDQDGELSLPDIKLVQEDNSVSLESRVYHLHIKSGWNGTLHRVRVFFFFF